MEKRRLLLIANRSLFGTGMFSLLRGREDRLMIKRVSDVETALSVCEGFRPDVIIYFNDVGRPGEEARLRQIASRLPARIIHCTLEADQLTIVENVKIQNATVEDLMSALLK